MKRSALIFLQLMHHDFRSYYKKIPTLLTNFCVIYPISFAFMFGYVMPSIYFDASPEKATILLAGHAVVNMLVLAYSINIMLLFDFDGDRYIDYEITIINPRILLFQRMLFAALFSGLATLPFFPIVKLLLGNNFASANTSWVALCAVIVVGSLVCSTYTIMLACAISNPRKLVRFWLRVNFILITLGGLFAPWHVIYQFSAILGYLVLLNPLLYITEGTRSALTGNPQFLSVPLCTLAMLAYATVFMFCAWYFFKKRMDHI